uniref:Dimer_Tnp_hAT domain-containing protein n=1 Tax=Macrostomum lignano TaxID=282301 RepID=A0A1I8J0Q7_9PLAT
MNGKWAVVSLTAKLIRQNFQLRKVTLCSAPIDGPSTGANMADAIRPVLRSFGIEDKVTCIVTDEGSAMQSAIRNLELPRESCAIHKLQNCVRDAMPDDRTKQPAQRSINDLVTKCRKIVKHFHKSVKASDEWRSCCNFLGQQSESRLVQCVKTRWDSQLTMLESCQLQAEVVKLYCSRYAMKPNPLTCHESVAWLPSYVKLAATTAPEESEVRTMASVILKSLENRFENILSGQSKLHVVSTMLDPHYRDFGFRSNADTLRSVRKILLNAMCENEDNYQRQQRQRTAASNLPTNFGSAASSAENASATASTRTQDDEASNKSTSSSSSGESNDTLPMETEFASASERRRAATVDLEAFDSWSPNVASATPTLTIELTREQAQKEISVYFQEPLLSRPADPKAQTVATLKWWAQNNFSYPRLAALARRYLCITPSSADSERLFSAENLIVTEKRNRLSPESAQRLLFIDTNIGSDL